MCCDSTALILAEGGQTRYNGKVRAVEVGALGKIIHIRETATGNPITIETAKMANNDNVLLTGADGVQIELHDKISVVKVTIGGNHFVIRVNTEPITKEKTLIVTMNGEEVNPRETRDYDDPIYWAANVEPHGVG